jgi:hypothetical protein
MVTPRIYDMQSRCVFTNNNFNIEKIGIQSCVKVKWNFKARIMPQYGTPE